MTDPIKIELDAAPIMETLRAELGSTLTRLFVGDTFSRSVHLRDHVARALSTAISDSLTRSLHDEGKQAEFDATIWAAFLRGASTAAEAEGLKIGAKAIKGAQAAAALQLALQKTP